MKRFNEFIKQLSLTQQLFALIFCFVTFFALFFFVYLNGNVDKILRSQVYSDLEETQKSIISSLLGESPSEDLNDYLTYSSRIQSVTIYQSYDSTLTASSLDFNVTKEEWKQIAVDITRLTSDSELPNVSHRGFYAKAQQNADSYYVITKLNIADTVKSKYENVYLLSKTYSSQIDEYRDQLVNSVIYITVIVVGFFFIILMMWVITLIHPLNQIRNYIEKVKQGKDAELKVNRKDEIGELADALVSMREDLAKQEKTKEEMIHNISHDLKTPIATIKSYGESIKDGIYPYETLEKSVDVIIENADRLENKVHSLLFMNRVEYLISQDCEGISSDMKEIVEKVVQANKVIKPEIEFVSELEEVWFDGLEEPWRVAVENIVENALRYAKTKIEIHLNEEDGLTIANDGPSMDEERIKVLFKPYEKGQGGKFGLGLSIVAKVVAANHYEVFGENTLNGVIFRIYKPKEAKKESSRNWGK